MDETPFGPTDLSTARTGSPFGDLGAVEVVDLLLLALARRKASALIIVPGEPQSAIRYEQGGASIDLTALDGALADALVARLAIIAGLDLAADREQVGRLRVATRESEAASQVELLLLVWRVAGGLAAEVRRIGGARAPAPAGAEAGRLAPGTEFGSYRIVGLLGRGGQGVVYRAEHVVLEKPVAIKVLHGFVARNPALAAQFVIEARAACRARHPGIIDVSDFGTLPDGRSYYVMELVEAATLTGLISREGALGPPRALAIGAQIVDALSAAAAQGVVHCDLKPDNIFVDDEDRVRLGDFGLAQIRPIELEDEMRAGPIVGTAHYMAPELMGGLRPDVRSDIYAVGCILFQMLTGHVPFTGLTPWDVLRQHAEAPVPDLVAPDGAMPAAVEGLVRRAMAKDPLARYQRPDEMLADLRLAQRVVDRGGWRRWLPP
jgi:eukaryotic-like serine/threonine-protein kinase